MGTDGVGPGGANNDDDSVNFHLPKLIMVKAAVLNYLFLKATQSFLVFHTERKSMFLEHGPTPAWICSWTDPLCSL